MHRGYIICLSFLLFGCGTPNGHHYGLARPVGIPACDVKLEFPGYQGGRIELENIASGSIGALHGGDLMYQMLGRWAEERMVIFYVVIENKGEKRITINRSSLKMVGSNGVIKDPISHDMLLSISRGSDISATGLIEQLGDLLGHKEFSTPIIDFGAGEDGLMMVAFPLPFPPNPVINVSIGTSVVDVPVCWVD